MRSLFPHGSHITRKRGIYCYRRRLPAPLAGELLVSLRTRSYREAEHRAELLDAGFEEALRRAVSEAEMTGAALVPILRQYLKDFLRRDLEDRMDRPPGHPVYAYWWEPGDPGTVTEADLRAIREQQNGLKADIAANRLRDFEELAETLLARHGLPPTLSRALAVGLMEARIRGLEIAERRTLGLEPLVFPEEEQPAGASVQSTAPETPAPHSKHAASPPEVPLASALVEPHFERRASVDRSTHQVMGQERGTLRRFLEVCGDRPVDAYKRGDMTRFLDTLRRLPNTYGRSPKDKDRPLVEIIAEADAGGLPRLTDKTVKRHLGALSQFFQFAVDQGHITVAARAELTANHRFREDAGAREQRDAWSPEELKALFSSPIWTGSHPTVRTRPGPEIIRDAKFWLPLLALFHGGRLEEFADLYRRDVGCENGIWFLRITEDGGRRLKTDNAERVIPLHPEVLRCCFLDYVRRIAPNVDDPLFPDLERQGKDGKRGARFTRFFVNYRKTLRLYREGVGMHAFRHLANTRLRDKAEGYQHDRRISYLLGHSQGGGEGRERYDKGPGLKALAETLALLEYPELDLSHLHISQPAAGPVQAA